ncbi:REP element-mobilizing transposase RayT [Cytobacillus eiseniae]|uniref:REP element-mobilizing transposase RayT n=1 Tax=Cytobacillus eiseniae TaxID=762947 RepID=A0ABS4RJ40_9BACI|nr:transposase [Cytobacillus eiseniae]MBP2242370.1 REP element-mobilizing transposase RayT [Cytobacillus eiseniae]
MPRRAREKSKSGIYHIMWRGANRQEIFHDDEDRIRYIDILERVKKKSQLKVYAWCLMSNHVHLLLKEEDEELSTAMKRVAVSYVRYYNWKYRTTGHLYQDRFKSENVETEQYLRTVVRYIHQNPVKARIVQSVEQWRWSSCQAYYEQQSSTNFLDKEMILKMYSTNMAVAIEKFRDFNEQQNNDQCLDDDVYRIRLSDDEARLAIKKLLCGIEITHVKSLPRIERNSLLQKVKGIEGVSQRQAARILGVSANLIFKA